MFIVYEDMSVSLNRGDVGVIPVPQSKDGDYGYSISAGDILRIRVFPKKKCEEVALVKDFLVETATSVIELELDGTDTKIGDIINKPTTYWYEIELNPDTYPQTIVGYNEDGPKVFMLYPEGDDSGELPSINTGKPVTVSDEAVKSIINNEIFKEILKNFQGGTGSVTDEHLAEIVAEYLANNPVVTVDDALSKTSKNPVQNKVIQVYIDKVASQAIELMDKKDQTAVNAIIKFINENFVFKQDGKGLSSNDFTDEYKEKLDNVTTGADGVSATHSWNGTTLTVTSASGTSSADLKGDKGDKGDTGPQGEKGADGYTPVKGTDYFTEADKKDFIEEVVSEIGDSSTDSIPSYWQSALDSGANAIRQAMETAGRNKSAFLFYSDAHWNHNSQMSPKLLKYLYKNTAMTKTFFGGDIVNSESTDRDTMEYLYEWREMLKGLPNHHSVVGNHDDGNATNNLFSENYVYAYLLAAEETPNMVLGEGMYYYIDEPCEITRYLFLDTAYKGVDTTQENFIKEALKSTQSGWHIVVVSHIWYMPDYNQYSVRPIPIAGLGTDAGKVITLLDNYNSRKGDFADCGGKVEFCIGGHVHRDYVGSTTGGIPIVLVETDSQHIRGSFSYTAGTTTESSVNGIVADYDNKVITVVRVGRGNGFTVNLESGETHTHSYTSEITTAATCTTAGVRTYTCECGDTYTEAIPAIGHTYVNGVCSVCGAEDSNNTPTYTNVLDTVGYTAGYRLNSSGKGVAIADRYLTGFIPCKSGDIIYLKNITAPETTSSGSSQCACYTSNSEDAFISGTSFGMSSYQDAVVENGNVVQFTVSSFSTPVTHIRISAQYIEENSIITVGQVIE